MGQGSSQLLTHTWIMDMAQKPWYITEKGRKRGGGGGTKTKGRKEVEERQRQKERKNPKPLIILLGHNRGCFLYLCMCNSFPLTLSTNIFSLDSDQLFLPLFTNLLFGLFGPESIPVLGSSQNWSLHYIQDFHVVFVCFDFNVCFDYMSVRQWSHEICVGDTISHFTPII